MSRKAKRTRTLSREFWLLAASAALVGFGFADWPLIAFHFAKEHVVLQPVIPILYAAAMGATGVGALVFGRLFDARGFSVLLPPVLIAAAAPPLVFLGNHVEAILGTICWGIALGVETSVLTAGVAHLVPKESRARAYGIFSAVFGIAWFAGSSALGALYDVSLPMLVIVAVIAELAAIVPLIFVIRAK